MSGKLIVEVIVVWNIIHCQIPGTMDAVLMFSLSECFEVFVIFTVDLITERTIASMPFFQIFNLKPV